MERPVLQELLAPYLADIRISQAGVTGTIRTDFAGFGGHFPGRPLLAGAFQLQMLVDLARHVLGPDHELTGVDHARFRRMLAPGDDVELGVEVVTGEAPVAVKAIIRTGGRRACQATLRFRRR
jgi:3-hydroxymyristoyl/3-hydroxydecanoyl-(acyl carrier protein) dehydratase